MTAKPKYKYEMCPACEACFRLITGQPIPPHRGFRGGMCGGDR